MDRRGGVSSRRGGSSSKSGSKQMRDLMGFQSGFIQTKRKTPALFVWWVYFLITCIFLNMQKWKIFLPSKKQSLTNLPTHVFRLAVFRREKIWLSWCSFTWKDYCQIGRISFPVPFRKPKRDQGAMMIQDDSGLNPWPTVNGSEIRPTSWVGYFNPIISDPGFIAS